MSAKETDEATTTVPTEQQEIAAGLLPADPESAEGDGLEPLYDGPPEEAKETESKEEETGGKPAADETAVADEDTGDEGEQETETETKEEEPDEAEAEVSGTDGFTPELLARARGFGISDEHARKFPNAEDLQTVIDDWAAREGDSVIGRIRRQGDAQGAVAEQPPPTPVVEQRPPEPLADYEPPTLAEDGDYPKDLVDLIKYQGEYIKKQAGRFHELQQNIDGVQGFIADARTREIRQMDTEFEDWAASLDGPAKQLLGEGRSITIPAQSDSYRNREKIAKQVGLLRTGYVASGVEPPPVKELCESAYRMVFAEHAKLSTETQTREEVEQTLRRRKGQFGTRPAQRRRRVDLPPGERAEKAVAAKMRDWGHEPEPGL